MDEYYDIVEKDKDRDKDKESETNFKQAHMHRRKPVHRLAGRNNNGATQRIGQNAPYHKTGRTTEVTVKTVVT